MKDTINAIANIRISNNDLWMQILDIAARYAPQETADVLRGISNNDAMIHTLLSDLAAELKTHEADGVLHD